MENFISTLFASFLKKHTNLHCACGFFDKSSVIKYHKLPSKNIISYTSSSSFTLLHNADAKKNQNKTLSRQNNNAMKQLVTTSDKVLVVPVVVVVVVLFFKWEKVRKGTNGSFEADHCLCVILMCQTDTCFILCFFKCRDKFNMILLNIHCYTDRNLEDSCSIKSVICGRLRCTKV